MKSIYCFLIFLCSVALIGSCKPQGEVIEISPRKQGADLPSVCAGTLERLDSFPSKWVTDRNVDVWLPEGYTASQKYPVLYMHDGQMLFDSTKTWNKQEWAVDEVMTQLIRAGKIKPCIVVGVWNGGKTRHPDYFPQKPFNSLSETFRDSLLHEARRISGQDLMAVEVRSDAYLRFLVEELKPFIDKQYATKKGKESTFIAGSSMGGLISMYAICEYPEVFAAAACLSTHWIGTFSVEGNPIPKAFHDYLANHLPNPENHRIYFDYGTATLDSLYEPFQLQADAVMKSKGYGETNWKTLKFEGADHSERAWQARLHIPFEFLMGR